MASHASWLQVGELYCFTHTQDWKRRIRYKSPKEAMAGRKASINWAVETCPVSMVADSSHARMYELQKFKRVL